MACPIGDIVKTTRFDITETLKEIAGPDDSITATVVIVPTGEGGINDAAFSVRTAELNVVKSTVTIAS